MAADCQGRLSPISPEILDDEALDPRIHGELERLNKASDDINKLELELDDERAAFRQALSDTTHKLNTLAKKLGSCVEKARPYYDQRHKVLEAHSEAQKVAIRFERACSMHEAAKEMVQLAEQGYMKGEASTDPAWQEMLNHATMKVNEAEKERNESETEHMKTMHNFQESDEKCQKLQKELKRAITKSSLRTQTHFLQLGDITNRYQLTLLPYFELKAAVNQQMEDNKRAIKILEEDVHSAKVMYSEALRNLEKISDSIHQQRIEKQQQIELGERGAGVGSETPSPPPVRQKDKSSIDGQNDVSINTEEYSSNRPLSGYQPNQFSLPSVIHESVERSRNQSYRTAIEHRTSIKEQDEFPVPSLESEYMSLPKTTEYSDRDTISTSVRELDRTRRNSAIRGSVSSETGSQEQERSPSRSRKSNKLKGGLILRIDNTMDPLAQIYQTEDIQPTRRREKSQKSIHRSQAKSGYVQENRSLPITPTQSNLFSPPRSSPSHSSLSSALSLPEEDRSDAESIASTGPMLDDDQVELLTMEFSEEVFAEEEAKSRRLDRSDSQQLNLPPKLSYLEKYIRQTSHENLDKSKHDDIEDSTEESTVQITEKLSSINLEEGKVTTINNTLTDDSKDEIVNTVKDRNSD
ncbi:SH3 domain-binding protein 5-like,SH3 domain-binding protein 5 homolog,SH3 domain-binding protein 5 [Mytilus coruscus]|uniref:SH3 domain-binding protein 5-like n=1 Tax=Mytilus coruscus TaxID=42192 RepID=A0A6J8D2K3_MYTCO|nr:SH3 domain-binding protein 5-like,SH3 domain-binding protein 5 homolog,SH3 domain-binding protein 5 [Mytilus coruscus]